MSHPVSLSKGDPRIQKMLELNSRHITFGDKCILDIASEVIASGRTFPLVSYNLDNYGWLIWIPPIDGEDFNQLLSELETFLVSPSFLKVITFARTQNVSYLRLDAEGADAEAEGLPLYDWSDDMEECHGV